MTFAFNVSRKSYLRKIIFSKNRWYDTFFRFWVECFGVLSKHCRRGCENCFLRAHRNIFSKRYFQKKYCFIFPFGTVGDNFLALPRKFFDEVVKTASFVLIKTLQIFFSEKYFGFWLFLFIERFFWTLCWKFPDEVVKTASYLFVGSFWWEKYFDEETLMFFIQFETFSDKFLAVCWEIFGRFVAIAIYVFIRFFPTEKIFVWKFHIFIISDNDRKNIELRQAFFGGVVKAAFYVCIRTFWQNLLPFWERRNLLSLSDLQRNFFCILLKFISEVLKTAVYVSIWKLWAKRVSWRLVNCFRLFRTLSKRFLTICREVFGGVVKTAFGESMPSISWKCFSLWKKYTCFGSFRYWANMFRPLFENFLTGLWQLPSMSPEEHIYEKYFFLKKNWSDIFFRPWAECFGVLLKDWRLSARLRKLLSTCPHKCFFSKKFFLKKK